MGKLYRCDICDREFILDNEPLSQNQEITIPYCPYCGRKSKGAWGKYEQATKFVREV